ncbi:hypothetical protein K7B04_15160 [Kluyvera sp. CRP]|nr:hypothetical protein K7B04_15160 [Kluyvera sp. CRP]
MTFALVKNSIVENTVICESENLASVLYSADYLVINIDGSSVGPGWSYDGETFTAPVIVKTPEEIATENLSTAQAEYGHASEQIAALNEQIEDADYAAMSEDAVRFELSKWTDYRKMLRAYLNSADGNQTLPTFKM